MSIPEMYYTTESTTNKLVQYTYRNTVFIVVVSFPHCLSASCGVRPTSLSETYVRAEHVTQLPQEMSLGPYPVGEGLTIGDVEFSWVPSPFFRTSTKMKITVYWEARYSTEYLTIGWLGDLHLNWLFFFFCIRKYEEVLLNTWGSMSIPGMWTMET